MFSGKNGLLYRRKTIMIYYEPYSYSMECDWFNQVGKFLIELNKTNSLDAF